MLYMHIGVLYKLWYSLVVRLFKIPGIGHPNSLHLIVLLGFLFRPLGTTDIDRLSRLSGLSGLRRQPRGTGEVHAPATASDASCGTQPTKKQRFTGKYWQNALKSEKKRGFLMLMAGATGHRLNNDGYGNYESIWNPESSALKPRKVKATPR